MKNKLRLLGLVLVLSTVVAVACGRATPTAQPTEPPTELPTELPTEQPTEPAVEIPEGAVMARDAALAFISQNSGQSVPPAGAAWTAERTTPEGLVGAEDWLFTSGDWTVAVSYPVVLPELVIYTVTASNAAAGFAWAGTVDPAGQVTEQGSGAGGPPEGWLLYTNSLFGYQFYYPADALIEQSGVMGYPTNELPAGMTPDQYIAQLQAMYGDNLCVSVGYGLGYVNISAPANEGFRYALCGRTGVGTGQMIDLSETIVIAGQSYTASGFEFIGDTVPCDTLSCHNETLVLNLPDGTRIEYGAAPLDGTYEDYLANTRDVLLQIVASFIPAPSIE